MLVESTKEWPKLWRERVKPDHEETLAMRRWFECFLVLGVVALILAATKPEPWNEKPVTLNLSDVTRNQALQAIAEQQGLELLPTPESEELVSVELEGVEIEEAIAKLSYDLEWKVIDDCLLVLPALRTDIPHCPIRMEYLVEAEREQILSRLRSALPQVRFTHHPTMKGFYAVGSRDELLVIKRYINSLENDPKAPLPQMSYTHTLNKLSFSEAATLVQGEFSHVKCVNSEGQFELVGRIPEVGQAYRFLQRQDRLELSVAVPKSKLLHAQPVCSLEGTRWTLVVKCPQSCPGPLQLLGFENGDQIEYGDLEPPRTVPEWWVTRQGKKLRIVNRIR